MIIVNLTGGLGNQMFQYAFGRYLSIKNNTELKYHYTNSLFNTPRKFELNIFNISATCAGRKDLKRVGVFSNVFLNRVFCLLSEKTGYSFNKNVITEKHNIGDVNKIKISDDLYIQGYWQDDKSYISEVENIIKNDFIFKKDLDKKNEQMLNLIKSVNSVSIHVRRTDYINNKLNSFKYGFVGLDYYVSSIDSIIKKVNNPIFFIFSDDIKWCKENFNFIQQKYFIDWNKKEDSFKDMQLMSLCKHNILANSTFSWWAAWLNSNKDKIVIKTK